MAVRVWWRTFRVVAFAVVSVGTILPGTVVASGPADDLVTLPVRLDNVAAVRGGDLRFAERRAAEVFEEIGVRVRWVAVDDVSAGAESAPAFTMIVVNSDLKAGSASSFVDALGLANRAVRRAYVFYDRVTKLNESSPRPIPTILGDIIAHELGHLVLPTGAHSKRGIMRAGLDMDQLSIVTFTELEARSILAVLSRTPAN